MQYILAVCAVILAVYYIRAVGRDNIRAVKLIYFEIIFNLIIKFLIGNMGMPSELNYISDFVLIWIAIEYCFLRKEYGIRIPGILLRILTIFLLCSFISYASNLYSPLLYLWGLRNNFRFLFFGIMCAVFLKKRDVETVMDILFGFFLLNIAVVTYQAFFVSYSGFSSGDFISGLFSNGAERGGNASLDWLMCIVCIYAVINYLNKTENIKKLLICFSGSLYMAAVAEIKLFFIQIILISLIAVLICKKSFKVFGITAACFAGLFVGISLLYKFFPGFLGFFSPDSIMKYVTRSNGYASRGFSSGVDRLTAIPYVLDNFLITAWKSIFGMGLGNADFSGFEIFTSTFYTENAWTGYTYFYSSFIMTELGLVGLAVYIINILGYLKNAVCAKTEIPKEKSLKQTSICVAVMAIFMIFANQTMKLEASAYMVYAVLALPFVLYNNEDRDEVGVSLVRNAQPVTIDSEETFTNPSPVLAIKENSTKVFKSSRVTFTLDR